MKRIALLSDHTAVPQRDLTIGTGRQVVVVSDKHESDVVPPVKIIH
jgi:hypothetical protein